HWQPRVVLVDERNIITEVRPLPPGGMAHPSAQHSSLDAASTMDIDELMREQVPYTGVKFRD
ncbi:MAG TPA: hypothetical protein VEX13_10420, partial [Chloroflexia bacterium]|nr:hypothetical protein [Chloroflexia bacterium]